MAGAAVGRRWRRRHCRRHWRRCQSPCERRPPIASRRRPRCPRPRRIPRRAQSASKAEREPQPSGRRYEEAPSGRSRMRICRMRICRMPDLPDGDEDDAIRVCTPVGGSGATPLAANATAAVATPASASEDGVMPSLAVAGAPKGGGWRWRGRRRRRRGRRHRGGGADPAARAPGEFAWSGRAPCTAPTPP